MELHTGTGSSGGWLRERSTWALLAFLGIAGFFLLTEHRAHLFGVLPYLLLLACPLIHLFGHGGHGGRDGHGGHGGGGEHGDHSDHRAGSERRPGAGR